MKHVFNRNRIFASLVAIVMLLSAMALSISAMTPVEDVILAEAVYGVPEKIDGILDAAWDKAEENVSENSFENPANATDMEVKWRVMYDNVYLYFFVEVIDSTLGDADFEFDAWGNYYAKNSIHMMFDMGYDRYGGYDADDFYIDISCQGYFNGRGAGTAETVKSAVVLTDEGYNVEVRLDHTVFEKFKAEKGTCFGFDLWGNDCLAPITGRLWCLTWADTTGNSWWDASMMGTIQLGEIPAGVTPTVKEEIVVERYPGIPNDQADQLLNGSELKELGATFEGMTNLLNPQGGGNKDISIIVDGKPGKSDGEQYDSYMATIEDGFDPWYGVNFGGAYVVDSVVFWEGGHWGDGGWFGGAPKLQLLKDGKWYDYEQTMTPDYREDSAAAQLPKFEPFIFNLSQPVLCEGVRVIGPGNQNGNNVSCSEIEVWGYAANTDVAHDTLDDKTPVDTTVETEPLPPVTDTQDTEETEPNEETTAETDDETTSTDETTTTPTTTPDTNKSEPNEGEFPWWILVIVAVVLGAGVVIVLGMKKKK